MYAHSYAVDIEHILCRVFGFDRRGGLAGLIDADYIEGDCKAPIASALGYMYAKADNSRKNRIEKFIDQYMFYMEIGISDLLLFTSNSRELNGSEYTIEYENGEKALEALIKALSDVCE